MDIKTYEAILKKKSNALIKEAIRAASEGRDIKSNKDIDIEKDTINENISKLKNLLEKFDISKIDMEDMDYRIFNYELAKFIESIESIMGEEIKDKNIKKIKSIKAKT